MQTVQSFLSAQKKRAEAKINFYNVEEISTVLTNSCPASFKAYDIGVKNLDQIIDYLADLYKRSHGGELKLSFSTGLIKVQVLWGNLEPDYISREKAENQALLAILA